MNFIEHIPNIVQGMDFKLGEVVLLHFWGDNKDLDILDSIAIEVGKNGATPLKLQQSREFIKDYYTKVDEKHLLFSDKYFEIFKIADSVVDIHTYPVPAPHRDFPKDKLDYYRQNLIKTMNSIMPNKDKFIQLRVPTRDNAEATNLEYNDYYERMINAYNIDYKILKSKSETLIQKLDDVNKIEVFTENGCVLSFDITDRKWHKDDGNGDLPCGEVYIAPLENTAEGSICIPKIYLDDNIYENIIMSFKKGVILDISDSNVKEYIFNLPEGAKQFAEFGIGLNENVTSSCGYALLDEKQNKTMHIAIGMNSMFGGKNESRIHLDFVFIPKKALFYNTEEDYFDNRVIFT